MTVGRNGRFKYLGPWAPGLWPCGDSLAIGLWRFPYSNVSNVMVSIKLAPLNRGLVGNSRPAGLRAIKKKGHGSGPGLWPLAVGLWRFGFWLFGCMALGYGGPNFWRCGLLSYCGSGHVPLATLQLAICSSGYLIS